MMQRVVSLILIPLLLVGQTFCAAHSHAGSGIAEPDGHAARPHIHLHLGKHHHHGHGHGHDHGHHHGHQDEGEESEHPASRLPVEDAPLDHDSDAIYISPTQLFRGIRTASVDAAKLVRLSVSGITAAPKLEPRLDPSCHSPHSAERVHGPLYLRTLRIRC